MDNEKDLNKELSLEEQLASQDEFAFLDGLEEDSSFEAAVQEEVQQEVQQDFKEEILDEEPELQEIQKNSAGSNPDDVLSTDDFKEIFGDDSNLDVEQTQEIEEIQEVREVEEEAPVNIMPVAHVEEDEEENLENSQELITVRPVKFQQFEDTPPNRAIKKNLDIMQDIKLHISVELGRTKSSIREVMEMEKGTVVELDKIAGEQVEIFANGKLVAKGEVIVIEDKFGVRVTNTNIQKVIP